MRRERGARRERRAGRGRAGPGLGADIREPPSADGAIPILEGEPAEAWVRSLAEHGRRADPPDVRPILDRVRREGDAALFELAEELDGVRPPELRVARERCVRQLESLPPARRRALERAARNIERFHTNQRRREPPLEVEAGVRAWREFRPIRRVGIYAPGGRASYPSSVLMTAVPARIAGCEEVVLCSPPGPEGRPAPSVLAAAALAGVDEVYAAGGAQAIAALAYGTETIAPVDKVFGPGNPWVDAAKLAVSATVPIDLPAGPSEVVAWADADTPPGWTAAELVAQAEHGPDSLCVGILPDRRTAAAVRRSLEERPGRRPAGPGAAGSRAAAPAAASLARGALLVAPGTETALAWIEAIAPEHLAILFEDARRLLPRIASAGSVFLGPGSPVAAGDYAAGPNHVLPTGRSARARGGLSLDDFGRWMQVLELEPRGLAGLAPVIRTLADWEGLPAHAAAVDERLEGLAARAPEPGARSDSRWSLLRPALDRIEPYVTARSLHRGGLLLDANENPFEPPVLRAADRPDGSEPGASLNRYPDPETPELRRRLAECLGISMEALWVGNGSDEAIDLLLRAAAGSGETCVVGVPTYGVYRARAAAAEVVVREVPLDAGFDLDVARTREAARAARLVLLCSPNNPTGNLLSAERILELAAGVSCLVAVDEAYVEFSGEPSLVGRIREVPNLAVIRTFSKAWGLAGARVGYLAADPGVARRLRRAGLPYPLSSLAARAAEAALDREATVRRRCDRLVRERERARAELQGLGLRVLPSDANFLLFFVDHPARIQRELAETHGIVVRDRSRLPRLAGGLRVSVGRPEENDRFLEALAAVLGTPEGS